MKFDIHHHVAISAGAGSGKTYTLTRRYVNILLGFNLFHEGEEARVDISALRPASPEEIVTITYTEAGALEMRGRIFSLIQKILAYLQGRLDAEDGDYPSIEKAIIPYQKDEEAIEYIRRILKEALARLPDAVISTIHAYCLHLIGRYGDYLGLEAEPTIMSDDEKTALFDDVYRQVCEGNDQLVEEIDQTVPFWRLKEIARRYSFDAGFRRAFSHYREALARGGIELERLWRAMEVRTKLEEIADGLEAALEMARLDVRKEAYTEALLHNFAVILAGEGEFLPYKGQLRANKMLEKELLDRVRDAKKGIGALWKTVVDAEGERIYAKNLDHIGELLERVHQAYVGKLQAEGMSDFDTILEYADALLEKDIPLKARYFMVDEFQDTNDFQWGIVKKAAVKQKANLFIVGDEKQSIFSFQGADVTVFGRAREDLGVESEEMTLNWRSERAIIEMVNEIFTKVMQASSHGADASARIHSDDDRLDVLLEKAAELLAQIRRDEGYRTRYTLLECREDREGGSVEMLVTSLNDDEENEGESEEEMRHIASYIHQVVTTDIHPEIKKAYEEGKPAIAVLFDTRNSMLRLKEKLSQLGLSAKVADSGNFYDTKEVNDIFIVLKLLTLMPLPRPEEWSGLQKYVVAGALRSNVLRLDGNAIDEAMESGRLPEILKKWKELSMRLEPAALIDRIVRESRLLHVYRQLNGYAQRVANIEKLVAQADAFAAQNGGGLEKFVRELERLIHDEAVEEEEAFVVEEGVGSIEIRTMHSSKGLEWPMVIVGSTQRSFMGKQPSESLVFDRLDGHEIVGFKVGNYHPLAYRFVKERTRLKHIEERKRLLYVAMTRPESVLVISTVLTKTKNGVRLCSTCGDNNYFTLINQALDLDLEELWEPKAEPVRYGKVTVRYAPEWKDKEPHPQKAPICPEPELKPLSFADRRIVRPSGRPDPLGYLEEDETFGVADAGTVVHKILEECWRNLDDDGCANRWLDAYEVPSEWRDRLLRLAKAFKRSPHYQKLMEGAEAYFEHPFTYKDEDGKRVHGSIDLLYYDEKSDGWVIVDFKTTALRGESPQEAMKRHGYDRQLDLYAEYVEKVLKERVVAKEICWLDALGKNDDTLSSK